MTLRRASRFWGVKGGGVGGPPIINALYMASFRLLNPSYTGYCVRIGRVSDAALLDVGFVSGYVDTAAIAAFCSGTTGHVKIWYDQSGNGHNYSSTSLPGVGEADSKIYQSGSFFTNGGKIGINITGSERLNCYTTSAVAFKSLFAVVKMNSLVAANYLMRRTTTKTDYIYLGGTFGGVNGFSVAENGVVRASTSLEDLNRNLQTYIGSSPKKLYTNGINLATETGSSSDLNIGDISVPGLPLNGNLQEILIYSDDKDSERVAIETEINTYYSIF